MTALAAALLLKLLGLGLVFLAFSFGWTGFQLWRGDSLAFRQARESHPKMSDALLGRAVAQPIQRPDAPLNDGMVKLRRGGRSYWYLNRRISDEQYDRLTK